jgi:uncharacterized protein Yka (UPF0111/DUF47 family)
VSSAGRIYDALEQQAGAVRGAARGLVALLSRNASEREIVQAAKRFEVDGADSRLRLEQTLLRTLSAPIDRDDLYAVSCALDTTLRSLTRTLHAFASGGLGPNSVVPSEASQLLVRSSDDIYSAIGLLRAEEYDSVVGAAGRLRRTRQEARSLYYAALLRLLEAEERDPLLLFDAKGALDRVDNLVVQCATVGARLAYVAVKNQ